MNSKKQIKSALAYCRVSSQEQTEGYSLESQEKLCRNYAENNGYSLLNVYRDEGRSGTNLDRPALQDLLLRCKENNPHIEAVLVQESDRLARKTADHLAIRAILKKADIKLISVNQPMLCDDSPESNMVDTILASVNQFYSELNSRKTKRGLQERFDSGWWPGWSPLGYTRKELENKKSIVVPDLRKWYQVKEAFKMYLTGNYSATEISRILYKKGLRSKKGKKVCNSIMINTFKNPFYTGIMKWNGQKKMGKHKPMITLEEHKQILTIMDAHNQHACRRRKYNFLLRGFVFCDICGQRYTAERHRIGKNPDYYHCSAKIRKHSNNGQNIEVKELEKQVEELFKNVQFSKEFIDLIIQKVRKFYQEKKREEEIKKRTLLNKKMGIERKRETAEEKLISGTLNDDDFSRIRDRFKEELDIIQDEINKIETKHDIDTDIIREVLVLSRNIYQAYKKAPYEIKRLYLAFFWDKIWVRDKKIVKTEPTALIDALIKSNKISSAGLRVGANKTDIILAPDWLRG